MGKSPIDKKLGGLKKYSSKFLKSYEKLLTNYSKALEEKEKLRKEIGDKKYLKYFPDMVKNLHSEQRQSRYVSEINSSLENMKKIVSELEEKMHKEFFSIFSKF